MMNAGQTTALQQQNPLRSGLLLQEDRITYTQVEQCADIVGKQIRQAILQSVKKMVVNTKQTIEGKELHQLMIKSIRGYLPDTAAGGKTKRKISLGAVLNKFVKLVDEPEVREESEPLKEIEETICKHYAEGVEGVPDTSMLKLKVQKLHDAYSKVLQRRTTEKDRIKEWLHVIREGNDSFREVYDNIWQQIIFNKERAGIKRYIDSVANIKQLLPVSAGKIEQAQSDPVKLYLEAAAVKPTFDKLVELEICKRYAQRSGGKELDVILSPKLKRMTRVIEKTRLKARNDSVARVKDIVRAMALVKSMDAVASVLDILYDLHKAGLVVLLRVKERFLESPSRGGWRDVLINLRVVALMGDVNNHICEFQIGHKSMFCARKGLPGHLYYGIVRNAMEMMDYCPADSPKMYSRDMAALVDFVPEDMHEGAAKKGWLREDVPLGKWAGVTTDAEQHVVGIDLRLLDPNLNQRHRLPHLQTLNLHGLNIKVTSRYLDLIGCDYEYHPNFSVNLYGCSEIDDEVFQGLMQLRGLVSIDLTFCNNISDTLLAALIERNVHLHPDKVLSTKKGPAFLTAVGKWRPDLDRIDLKDCPKITDAHLAVLIERHVHLHPDKVLSTKKGLAFLTAVGNRRPYLRCIDLKGCPKVTDVGLKQLTQGCPKLTTISLNRCEKVTDDGIKYLAQHCPKLVTVDLSEIENISGAGFEQLAQHCPNLVTINLKGCKKMTDVGLVKLAYGCPNLTTINLERCEHITDFALMQLAQGCPKITTITLNKCENITDNALMQLAQDCSDITKINLEGCENITDDGLNHLAQHCSKLATINILDCNNITDDGLKYLAQRCTNLVTINFAKCSKITDKGLSHIAHNKYLENGCRNLVTIDMHQCANITDNGLKYLAQGSPNLVTINLDYCQKVRNNSLKYIAQNCTNLTTISLWWCNKITDDGLRLLAQGCPNLVTISLKWCNKTTDDGLKHLAQGCPKLATILLDRCDKITDDGLKHLTQGCPNITTIHLRECKNIADSGLKHLSQGCPNLVAINLYMCAKITDGGLKQLSQGCRHITSINLSQCKQITNLGLDYLARGCHNLTTIKLYSCRKITDDGLDHFAQHCPNISLIDLRYCKITDYGLKYLKQLYPGVKIEHSIRDSVVSPASSSPNVYVLQAAGKFRRSLPPSRRGGRVRSSSSSLPLINLV